jgi:hypothetical protein
MSMHICIMSLLKVVDQSWDFGMKISRVPYGWISWTSF